MPAARAAAAALAVLAAAVLVGALAGGGDSAAAERVTVVATTTQAADLARNVAGPHVRVSALLRPDADPHAYEVRPHDLERLADADLVVRSGGDLDEWLGDAIAGSGSNAPVLDLSAHVSLRPDDPHWWHDPRNAERAVGALAGALAAADPPGRAGYAARGRAYAQRVRALDREVTACVVAIPPERRKLVTTHDSLGYYAARYGLRVVGTVLPARTSVAQPSSGEVRALVQTIRREHVPAIFAESAVHPKVEEAIAAEAGARVGAPLWADTLGPPGSGGATYLQSIAANTRAIAGALGAPACRVAP
jgi:zinc/manganese transport system substrate-binding protein/manganese/iron transport system substrate-binding protein